MMLKKENIKLKESILFLSLCVFGSFALAQLPAPNTIGAINDVRYCGEPDRYIDGRIKRSAMLLTNFAKVFPCPSTLLFVKSCVG